MENICDLPVFCRQPIEETAASVIETFVVTMKLTAQSSKDRTKSLSKDESELRTSTDTLSVDDGGRAGKVQTAATKVYIDVKTVLKDFFLDIYKYQVPRHAATATQFFHCRLH